MKQRMDYPTFIMAGIRNKPGRNLATVLCFAFIAANLFSAQYLIAGAVSGVDKGVLRMGADLLVVPTQYSALYYRETGPENTAAIVKAEATNLRFRNSTLDFIRTVNGVAGASPQLYVGTVVLPEYSSSPADVFGIDPVTDFTLRPWLHDPADRMPGPGEVIVGDAIVGSVLSPVRIKGNTYTITGKLDPTGTSVDHTFFLPMDDAYTLAAPGGIVSGIAPVIKRGDINAVLIRLEPGADPDIVGARIRQPSASVAVIERHFTLNPVSENAESLAMLLNIISAGVILAAFPLIALIAALVAHERQREIGLLRAMGAKRKDIMLLTLAEALILAAAGGCAGVGASLLGIHVLHSTGILAGMFQISYGLPALPETGWMAGIAFAGVMVIGTLATLYPAYKNSVMNPYDAILRDGQ
jgi:putative ABC transport system permease protein